MVGSKEYNLQLSTKRAKSVKSALVNKGIAETRLESKGMAFFNPVSNNNSELGMVKKRRIALVVKL